MIKSSEFRKKLIKIMPGYKWTVHRPMYRINTDEKVLMLTATGIQVAGKNRTSTLEVSVSYRDGEYIYNSKSSGFGKNAPWLSKQEGPTLAQSLRNLQEDYEITRNNNLRHAADLQGARAHRKTSS